MSLRIRRVRACAIIDVDLADIRRRQADAGEDDLLAGRSDDEVESYVSVMSLVSVTPTDRL